MPYRVNSPIITNCYSYHGSLGLASRRIIMANANPHPTPNIQETRAITHSILGVPYRQVLFFPYGDH